MCLAVGSVHSGLWEPGKCPLLFSRMEMRGANELDGFRAPARYFILSESPTHIFSSSVPNSVTRERTGSLGLQEALSVGRDGDTQIAFKNTGGRTHASEPLVFGEFKTGTNTCALGGVREGLLEEVTS